MSLQDKKLPRPAVLAAAGLPLLLVALPVLFRACLDFSDASARSGFLQAFLSPRSWRVLGFSLSQALLSSIIAILLGFPAAYLAASYEFPGKKLLSSLFSLPFIVPSLLLVLGLAGFFGNSGFLNSLLAALGLGRINFIYGVQGIVLAHAFFNFPIAARSVNASLRQADPSLREAALLLGAGRARLFLTLILPEALPGLLSAFFLIFLYCFQSFAIILLLGGGPAFSTLEVEIYQAMRLTFEPGKASFFALLELLSSLALALLYVRASGGARSRISRPAKSELPRIPGAGKAWAFPYLGLIALILGGPLASILIQAASPSRSARALSGPFSRFLNIFSADPRGVAAALTTTLSVGILAALIAVLIGFIAADASRRSKTPALLLSLAVLPLAVSPIVLSRSFSAFASFLPPLGGLILFHALLALPLASQFIRSGLAKFPRSLEEAAQSLGASPARSLFTVKLPLLRRSLLSAFFFSFCVSASDLSGVLSLRLPGVETLSLRIYRLAGAYRFEDACALGVFLLVITGIAFAFQEEG